MIKNIYRIYIASISNISINYTLKNKITKKEELAVQAAPLSSDLPTTTTINNNKNNTYPLPEGILSAKIDSLWEC